MDIIDFSNTGLEPVDAGTYDAVVSRAEVKTSKSGNPMISMEFTLQNEPYEGRKVFDNLSLLPKSLWATKKALINLGVAPEDLAGKLTLDGIREACAALIGGPATLQITVGTRADTGEPNNDVTVIKPSTVFGF